MSERSWYAFTIGTSPVFAKLVAGRTHSGQSRSDRPRTCGNDRAGELHLPEMQRRYLLRSTRVRDRINSLHRAKLSGAILQYPLAIHPEHDCGSFDLNLDRLLGRKRELSASVLALPEVSDAELTNLLYV